MIPSNRLILCRPFLLLPSIFPNLRVFTKESVLCVRWPKYQSFSFSISPPREYSGLISFRTDWLDLFAVQATLKSLLQQHSSKASILRHSAFFMVQLSHPNISTGKTIALTGRTFVSQVMSLLFNTLSRFVIAFLLKEAVDGNVSSCALWYQIAWVQIPALPLISNVISGSKLASLSLGFLIYDIHGKTVTFVHFQINDMMRVECLAIIRKKQREKEKLTG